MREAHRERAGVAPHVTSYQSGDEQRTHSGNPQRQVDREDQRPAYPIHEVQGRYPSGKRHNDTDQDRSSSPNVRYVFS